jgi:hypothetical protein
MSGTVPRRLANSCRAIFRPRTGESPHAANRYVPGSLHFRCGLGWRIAAAKPIPRPPKPPDKTFKLSEPARQRLAKAMRAAGYQTVSQFCRAALLEKCRATERKLLNTSVTEYFRIYGRIDLSEYDREQTE